MEEALTRWVVVREKARDGVDGFLGCGRCLETLGRLDEAERQFGLALRRVPDELRTLVGRAVVSDRRRDWQRSLERWKFMAEEFKYPPANAFVAKALAELGRIEEAEEYLRQPSMFYPQGRGNCHHIRQPRSAARRPGHCRRSLDPCAVGCSLFPRGMGGRCKCLAAAGLANDADTVLRAAIARFPDKSWPPVQFARLAHERRDWGEAVARWERGFAGTFLKMEKHWRWRLRLRGKPAGNPRRDLPADERAEEAGVCNKGGDLRSPIGEAMPFVAGRLEIAFGRSYVDLH